MGTKRAFDEDLQEFIKHPRHINCGSNPASVAENKLSLETFQVVGIGGEGGRKYFYKGDGPESEHGFCVPDIAFKDFEISAPLPLVTGVDTGDDDVGPGPVFSTNLFSEYFESDFPRRQMFHYEDIYSSLFNSSPRKVVPVGPDNQADVPEFDIKSAESYKGNGGMEPFLGVCVIPDGHPMFDSDIKMSCCKCLDDGSIRCVQQHVQEARLNLRKIYGDEKFADMGMLDMGEEVADGWTEEEEQLFHEVVYSNPASIGRKFWKQLSVAFPSRTKKELVSYYFNVFILRRRAVQNRSHFLDIDSDDDEWRESDGGSFGDQVEDGDYVLLDHHEDGGNYNDSNGGGEVDVVTGIMDQPLQTNSVREFDVDQSVVMNENKVTFEDKQENGSVK